VCETAKVPSSATWQPLDVLGFALTAVAALVPADQLESLHWYHHAGDQPQLEVTLSEGERFGCYLPDYGSGLEQGAGYVTCWVFRSLQRVLSTTGQLWGQALPGCPGHRHQSLIRERDGQVQLYCPATGETVRVLAEAGKA
jgi:hypothetical protein